jgi:hypothetical protein
VSSRARFQPPFLVGDELAVDDVGKPSFECPDGFHGGLAGGEFAAVVGTAVGVVAQLHDGHDVQHPVDAPVACPGEAVPLLLSGGGVQWCGAVPGREVPAGGEAGDVSDVAEQPGGAGRPDAVAVEQLAAGGGDEFS